VVVALIALITVGVAALVWRSARAVISAQAAGLAAVLGGAVANLLDRAGDGLVTDYLYTGWWPTFNLADTAIVTGAALALLGELRGGEPAPTPSPASARRAASRRSRADADDPAGQSRSSTAGTAAGAASRVGPP
jgi:signal peptidase II